MKSDKTEMDGGERYKIGNFENRNKSKSYYCEEARADERSEQEV